MLKQGILLMILVGAGCSGPSRDDVRKTQDFTKGWEFTLDEIISVNEVNKEGISWRALNLPHDWSIEGEFSPDHPATVGGGALPGGVGWYKKRFFVPESDSSKHISIRFDGIYMNSDVWINGEHLGHRPNGYIGFTYDLSDDLNFGEENEITVKVDNSKQPNSRWYSGSGIYRNVWLTKTGNAYIKPDGVYIYTRKREEKKWLIVINTELYNNDTSGQFRMDTRVYSKEKEVISSSKTFLMESQTNNEVRLMMEIEDPELWSLENPNLYTVHIVISKGEEIIDNLEQAFGFRTTEFDLKKGFLLNGKPVKILGVNNHHDLGALGAAVSTRALERQLEILRGMGVNAIRTSHNPPAPELLELTDKMGFLVMDEVFDVWKKSKVEFDYGMYWDEWHEKDLRDFIKRDRNHPSVVMWSIGNEILEQWGDQEGTRIANELSEIVRSLDTTRVITDGMNPPNSGNTIATSGALDVIGYNYYHQDYEAHFEVFPNTPMIATETTSALATRGSYDIYLPSDSLRRWPERWDKPFLDGNTDNSVSAYDHVSTPWGSTHEETWKVVKRNDFISGMFIWTGFDYLGEPTPYTWPSRSSYFGVVDLAGFPKDSYYMYKSEWTDENVLHIFPHWNWAKGDTVDIWAYYNNADEVELFLNGIWLGSKAKKGDDLHVQWRVPFEPGTLKATSRKNGEEVLTKEVITAGPPAQINLKADRTTITADGKDLSFITVEVLDADGNLIPNADNLVTFDIEGPGFIAGVDNGDPTSHESFMVNYRKAFNGLALAIVQSEDEPGNIIVKATSDGLEAAEVTITSN
tara:strand:- start:85686 stop:88100 length:2415 start_codon:yes stop_codon:yes gene_type:complete